MSRRPACRRASAPTLRNWYAFFRGGWARPSCWSSMTSIWSGASPTASPSLTRAARSPAGIRRASPGPLPSSTCSWGAAMLDVANLHAGYGSVPVLEDVSLTAASGEILLIGGENGAGKSTLLRAIAGFNRPSRGQVLLHGRPLQGLAPEAIARAGLRLV